MQLSRKVLTAALALIVLTGCSPSEPSEPTHGAPPTSSGPAAEEVGPGGSCVDGFATSDDLSITFGEISAASDEWSESLDRTWRHYYPVTITNTSSAPCSFDIDLSAEVGGTEVLREDIYVALEPGQTYRAQAFDLESGVDFTADAADATPAAAITPSVGEIRQRRFMVDYYDAEVTVGETIGKGADAKLTAELTVNGRTAGLPDRISSAKDDSVQLNGLDAEGTIIAIATQVIDPIAEGQTGNVEFFVAGGDASGGLRKHTPLSVLDEVVSWEIGKFQPFFTDGEKVFL